MDRQRILIVDDKPENIESAKETISPEAFEIVTATSYEEAIQFLNKEEFDWVMTDLYLPRVK